MTLVRLVAPTILAVLVAAPAVATDRPIGADKLVVTRSRDGREKLVFVSRDPNFLFPAIGSGDDPGTGGAVVELFSPVESSSLAAPAGGGRPGWRSTDGATGTHRFTHYDAPDGVSPVRSILLREGHVLKVVARQIGLALTGPQGVIAIRITTGTLRSCAAFDSTTSRRDEANTFVASHAAAFALSDCSDTTLGNVSACGNGRIETGEQCDLYAPGECAEYGASCRSEAFRSGCECCLDGGPGVQILGCCNPSSILIPAPNTSGACIATRCDPPYPCTGTDVCRPDGSCCSQLSTLCLTTVLGPPIGLNSCCPGLACRGPHAFGVGCCVPDGGTCTADTDCCSQHCGGSGTCDACRAGGGPCTSPFECCSLSCSSGACDACAPAGASCLSNETCCSASCDGTTATCD